MYINTFYGHPSFKVVHNMHHLKFNLRSIHHKYLLLCIDIYKHIYIYKHINVYIYIYINIYVYIHILHK
jgi:hypothetical protein